MHKIERDQMSDHICRSARGSREIKITIEDNKYEYES